MEAAGLWKASFEAGWRRGRLRAGVAGLGSSQDRLHRKDGAKANTGEGGAIARPGSRRTSLLSHAS
jgi:hypothetical protein